MSGYSRLKIIPGSDLDKLLRAKGKKVKSVSIDKSKKETKAKEPVVLLPKPVALPKPKPKAEKPKAEKPKGTVYRYDAGRSGGGARLIVIDAVGRGNVAGDPRVIIEENEKFVKMTLIDTDYRFTTKKNRDDPSKDLRTKKITRKAFDKLVANGNLVVSKNQSLKPLPIFKKKPAPKRKETEEEAFDRIFSHSSVLDDKFNM